MDVGSNEEGYCMICGSKMRCVETGIYSCKACKERSEIDINKRSPDGYL